MTEERAAQILNITMVMLLGALALGVAAWACVSDFGDVRAIYRSLPSSQQTKVNVFLGSVVFLSYGVIFALRFLGRWRAHPMARPVFGALKEWGALAIVSVVFLAEGNWKWTLGWFAFAVVLVAADLIERWRTRQARRADALP